MNPYISPIIMWCPGAPAPASARTAHVGVEVPSVSLCTKYQLVFHILIHVSIHMLIFKYLRILSKMGMCI